MASPALRVVRATVLVCALVVLAGGGLFVRSATAADSEPDLSSVTLNLDDLPGGFRVVPEDQLEDVGGSAKQVGLALERSLQEASLQQYVVDASATGDELIEMVLVGPLVPAERVGILHELADPAAVASDLAPAASFAIEQSEPKVIATAGIGDASVGFAIDSRRSSDSTVVTNILGVEWTAATTQFVLAVRGDYVAVFVHQYVGNDHARVDFLGAVRHVDAHLAAALGLAAPGVFRPGGTFSPAVANNIPTAGDISTDPPVVFANLVLAAVAVIMLSIGVRALNTALVAHETALERILRPARAVGRWWSAADRQLTRRARGAAGALRVIGVLLFYGVLFSFLEDGWRPWTASGLFVLAAMTIAFGLVGTADDMVELRTARRSGLAARLVVKPALVLFAMGSVALTKVAGLVPGLMIGTPEAFSLEDEADERNEMRLAGIGLGVTAAVGLGAWLLATPLDAQLDGSTGVTQSVLAGLVSVLVLVFAVAVENLFANLLAFPGSEGAVIRRHHRVVWWLAIGAVTALFFHTLVNPRGDLAESLRSTNVRVVLGTVAVFTFCTIVVRVWFGAIDRRARTQQDLAPPAVAPAMVAPATVAAPTVAVPMDAVPMAAPTPAAVPPVPNPPLAVPAIGFVAVPLDQLHGSHRHDPVRVARWVTALVVLLVIGGLIGVVVAQHGRDSDHFAAAHRAYLAGDCETAIAAYDTVLGDGRLADTAGVEQPARREREECVAVTAIAALEPSDPAGAVARSATFLVEHPDSALQPVVVEHVAALLRGEDSSRVASLENCSGVDHYQTLGLVSAADAATLQSWCAVTYEAADRAADAYRTALTGLRGDASPPARAAAVGVVLRSAQACTEIDVVVSVTGVAERPDEFATFLTGCMADASAAADDTALAHAQVAFLSNLADHPDAPAVEAALIQNFGACALLDEIGADPVVANRAGLLPSITLQCAQSAEYVQDYDAAIERYQDFIDANPLDPRLTAAQDGLARSLIAQARLAGTGELPAPNATGSTASGQTSVVIANDSPYELRIVVSGSESRIVIVPASPTSSEYAAVGPLSCRTDVPTITLTVPPGTYDVLVDSMTGGVHPFTGTWTLASGAEYASCFFVVTSFG